MLRSVHFLLSFSAPSCSVFFNKPQSMRKRKRLSAPFCSVSFFHFRRFFTFEKRNSARNHVSQQVSISPSAYFFCFHFLQQNLQTTPHQALLKMACFLSQAACLPIPLPTNQAKLLLCSNVYPGSFNNTVGTGIIHCTPR